MASSTLVSLRGTAAEVTYESVVQLIQQQHLTSIEQLLPLLPKEYRSESVLMHTSKSKQEASYENPRVILSGSDGKLVMAFNGDPSQVGFNKLELIQWRDESKSFEFREITFPQNSQGKIEFSAPNPKACLDCHGGNDPRPNWHPYPSWPGAFGSQDDIVGDKFDNFKETFPTRHSRYDFDQGRKEALYVDKLKLAAKTHPRYKFLENLNTHYDYPGELDRLKGTPNSNLTGRLADLNFQRIARKIKTIPNYQTFKYAILGAIDCYNTSDPTDHKMRDFFPSGMNLPEEYQHRYQPITKYQFDTHRDHSDFQLEELMRILGVKITSWAMNFEPVQIPKHATSSFATPNLWSDSIIYWIGMTDPDLKSLVYDKSSKSDYAFPIKRAIVDSCKQLAEKSTQAIKRWIETNRDNPDTCYKNLVEAPKIDPVLVSNIDQLGKVSIQKQPKVIQQCTKCHQSLGREDQRIPFDDEKKLGQYLLTSDKNEKTGLQKIKSRLSRDAFISGQGMPPSGPLNQQDHDILIQYLEKLAP